MSLKVSLRLPDDVAAVVEEEMRSTKASQSDVIIGAIRRGFPHNEAGFAQPFPPPSRKPVFEVDSPAAQRNAAKIIAESKATIPITTDRPGHDPTCRCLMCRPR